MGKRSDFQRRPMDAYQTIDPRAIEVLRPFLRGVRLYAEPCRGEGRLERQLGDAGLVCIWSSDIADDDAPIDALTLTADDLGAAEAARAAADAEEQAWRIAEGKQRAQAHDLIAAAKAEAARNTQAALDAASARIEETTAAAEARIAAARAAAQGEVQDVAAQAAQDIVSRLAGLSVSAEDARGAVQGVLAHG